MCNPGQRGVFVVNKGSSLLLSSSNDFNSYYPLETLKGLPRIRVTRARAIDLNKAFLLGCYFRDIFLVLFVSLSSCFTTLTVRKLYTHSKISNEFISFLRDRRSLNGDFQQSINDFTLNRTSIVVVCGVGDYIREEKEKFLLGRLIALILIKYGSLIEASS